MKTVYVSIQRYMQLAEQTVKMVDAIMAKKLRQMIMSHMITEQASFLFTFANQQLLQLTITKKCF